MPLFLIYFNRLILTQVHFTYSNFAWGLLGGVDVMWCGGLFVWRLNLYVLKVGHGFICIKVRIISINIIVNVKNFFYVRIIATVI